MRTTQMSVKPGPMIKRLGMWNRLALVLTVLAALIVPAAIAIDISNGLRESQQAWYDLCMSYLKGKELEDSYLDEADKCRDDLLKPIDINAWDDYWTNALWTVVGCAIIYGFLWTVIATILWILAGRKNNS